jgi:hypothetical protein
LKVRVLEEKRAYEAKKKRLFETMGKGEKEEMTEKTDDGESKFEEVESDVEDI